MNLYDFFVGNETQKMCQKRGAKNNAPEVISLTWSAVSEEANKERDVVHLLKVWPDVLDAARQLSPVAHVVLQHGVRAAARGFTVLVTLVAA